MERTVITSTEEPFLFLFHREATYIGTKVMCERISNSMELNFQITNIRRKRYNETQYSASNNKKKRLYIFSLEHNVEYTNLTCKPESH